MVEVIFFYFKKESKVVGGGTVPWAIFIFRISKIKISVWKSDKLTMNGNFCLDFYQYWITWNYSEFAVH